MDKLFHAEIAANTYLISESTVGPNEDGMSLAPGTATANSYLVVGSDEAILIDLSVRDRGLVEYALKLAGKPLKIVLTHAHVDHIFYADKYKELWLHPDDEKLLRRGAFPFQKPMLRCPKLQYLNDGEWLDLGNRPIQVIHIPGHTDGSVMFYDLKHRILFSGDSIARRLLYGLHTKVPVDKYVASLERVRQMDIDKIYSIHDRCALSKDNIDYMIPIMNGTGNYSEKVEKIPVLGEMTTREAGAESELLYFSYAFNL